MKKLAIVGASGLVGQEVLKVLQEENLADKFDIFMFVSDKSAGKVVVYSDKYYTLFSLDESVLKTKFDYAIFLTGEDISGLWVKRFSENGTIVIDNSSAFRMKDDVPLIVPEINIKEIKKNDKIIANPNCSTIQLVVVLDRLRSIGKINRLVVSSYQSVSGAGKDALLDLENNTNKVFAKGIKDNIIPQIGGFVNGLDCSEESKIICETKKILKEDFDVFATAVRIPTSYCHGESVFVEFESKVDLEKAKACLNVDYIKLNDENVVLSECRGTNFTYVNRLRRSKENVLQMFITADNLRRGAAYNAVVILKSIIINKKE